MIENLNRRSFYGISGIYRIYTNDNLKSYIGSSTNLYKRINGHINGLIKNKSQCVKLQNYVNKHGLNDLLLEILETFLIPDHKLIEEQETYYITLYDAVNNGFNCLNLAYTPTGSPWTEEQKENHKTAMKNMAIEYRDSLLHRLELARKSLIDNPVYPYWLIGREFSEETLSKMRQSAHNRGINYQKSVLQYDKNNNFIAEYASAREAERITNVPFQNIGKCCLHKRKTAGKFIWKFKQNPGVKIQIL
jgi:group I intron endonuclease